MTIPQTWARLQGEVKGQTWSSHPGTDIAIWDRNNNQVSYFSNSQCAVALEGEETGQGITAGVENFSQGASTAFPWSLVIQRDSHRLPSTSPWDCSLALGKMMGLKNSCHLSLLAGWGILGSSSLTPGPLVREDKALQLNCHHDLTQSKRKVPPTTCKCQRRPSTQRNLTPHGTECIRDGPSLNQGPYILLNRGVRNKTSLNWRIPYTTPCGHKR